MARLRLNLEWVEALELAEALGSKQVEVSCTNFGPDGMHSCREKFIFGARGDAVAVGAMWREMLLHLYKHERDYQAAIDDSHPESYCHRCGGPNVVWTVPSPLWNQVMRGGDINGPELHDGIVCPACFVYLAEQGNIATGWRLVPTAVHTPLQTITPSGRVWDGEKWLWVEPPVLKIPAEWMLDEHRGNPRCMIADADGWRGTDRKSLDVPISRDEFNWRVGVSTITCRCGRLFGLTQAQMEAKVNPDGKSHQA